MTKAFDFDIDEAELARLMRLIKWLRRLAR